MRRLLELFLETGSMGRAFAELGKVTSLDVDPKAKTICADICTWEPLLTFAPGHFDMIWTFPVCTEHRRVLTRRPRRLEEGSKRATVWCSEPPSLLSFGESSHRAPKAPSLHGVSCPRDVSCCIHGYLIARVEALESNCEK